MTLLTIAIVGGFALLAAALVALPRGTGILQRESERVRLLRAEHATLLRELAELDEDAHSGRISPEDRRRGRRELAPRLRAVTEALVQAGEAPRAAAPTDPPAADAAPSGAVPSGAVPSVAVPSEPSDAAPSDAAPSGAVPSAAATPGGPADRAGHHATEERA